jgi:ubiquinone/menaquinone biosynthesis C-methylase UbiE
MDKSYSCPRHPAGETRPHRMRPSSYWMHDPTVIFRELALKPGDVFLDLGCGSGDYSIRAAKEVGKNGVVYAADVRTELLENLAERAGAAGLNNIQTVTADLRDPLPFYNGTVDVCFISTVLHSLDLEKAGCVLFPEIRRVLKPAGRMIVIECKKEEMPFGPPLSMRISPDELEGCITAYGFMKTGLVDLGYNYLINFVLSR